MLRDIAAWLLYSPRRLVSVAVPVVVIAALAVTGFDEPDEASTEPSPAGSKVSALPSAPPSSPGGHDGEDPAAPRVIRKAASEFLGVYVVPRGAQAPNTMPPSLRKRSTPALWRGLRVTRPDSLPRGSVSQLNVEATGPFSGMVTAELDSGQALQVSVVAWEKGWRVSDIRSMEAQ
jgi:hypothetical protein